VSLSKDGLERMHDVLAAHVERGAAPGVVALVWRAGELHVDPIGVTAVGGSTPMKRDTIFRVASMSKPVTAVAAMVLVEECALRLDDPVDDLLPELADPKVLVDHEGPLEDAVPANRPITLRDLLTFRLGTGMFFASPESPYMRRLAEIGSEPGPPQPQTMPAPGEYMKLVTAVPLVYQPGEKWLYNTGADVAGVLIERATGSTLEAFMRERIFDPLGMADTSFFVAPEKLDRFTTSYVTDPATGALMVFDEVDGQWSKPPAFCSGAGGLVSTVDDFCTFGRMLLGGGTLNGSRVLSRASVATMTTNQLTPENTEGMSIAPGYFDSHGWGFGMSVVTRLVDPGEPVGTYGWDGGLGTVWKCTPSEQMITCLLTQAAWTSPNPPAIARDFWTTAHAAADEDPPVRR
jgi:CubicO group peptidase (beta-lactamase class C family)